MRKEGKEKKRGTLKRGTGLNGTKLSSNPFLRNALRNSDRSIVIDVRGAMPEPKSGGVDLGPEPVGDPARESLQQFQGQACAGLAVRRRREREPGQAREMIDRGVAVKDLEQERVDRGDRVQHGGASLGGRRRGSRGGRVLGRGLASSGEGCE